ncbi:hypothetical protein [Haladaptatus sp. R4]|uniref:hypothetical protein n=1 Tax=Haladaptatus sp. R4 TaxID=1679489 RepID=UPI001CBE2936|nr:hypothetical protein [Haladaptatus sp. R4]
MLESTVRTPLGGVGVVVTAGALVFAQRGLGLLAGLTLFALWAFLPAVYAFDADRPPSSPSFRHTRSGGRLSSPSSDWRSFCCRRRYRRRGVGNDWRSCRSWRAVSP